MSDPKSFDALLARIERLESLDAIRQLPAKYALSVDMRDLDALVNLFVEDVKLKIGDVIEVGRPALKRWYDGVLRNNFAGSSHHIGGHVIEFEDADHALGIVYSKNEHETGPEWSIQQMLYYDRYVRVCGRWYFQRRVPMYWYLADINRPPLGEFKIRWPGQKPEHDNFHDLFPTWKAFWSNPEVGSDAVAPEAGPEGFIASMRNRKRV
ncbi:MAG: nuclear transport factor 2 family protein [Steroidobacteraceae bacterium]